METEQERLERELREAEERYRAALGRFNQHSPPMRWLAKRVGNWITKRND